MKRKTLYTLALLFIVVDVIIAASFISAGERRLSAFSEGVIVAVELVRKFIRPLPKL